MKSYKYNGVNVVDGAGNSNLYTDGNTLGTPPYDGMVYVMVLQSVGALVVDEEKTGKLHIFASGEWRKVDAE